MRTRWNPFRGLVIYFENFTYCYRKGCSFFAAFYFFVRTIFQSIQSFSLVTPLQQIFKCMVCVSVCVVFTFVQPYDNKRMMLNYFDSFVLANLTVISLISLSMRSFAERYIKMLAIIMNILILLPFFWVAINFIRLLSTLIKDKCCQKRGRYVFTYFFQSMVIIILIVFLRRGGCS